MTTIRNTNPNDFTDDDLDQLVRDTFIRKVVYHSTLESTQDSAATLVREANEPLPLLVLTANQTAGRGRGSNRWHACAGALTFSLVLDAESLDIPDQRFSMIALACGLAIADALSRYVESDQVKVKWPNDVYVDDRKICGILCERHGSRVIVGVGINVNNAVGRSNVDGQAAISLIEKTQETHALTAVLIHVLNQLGTRLPTLGDDLLVFVSQWRQRCWLNGHPVIVDQSGRQIRGVCHGIDENGALLLDQGDADFLAVIAGSVTRLSHSTNAASG